MRKFDLEAAKSGTAVFTRDGRNVDIVSFTMNNERPILAIITEADGYQYPVAYFADGSICKRKSLKNKGHENVVFTEKRNEDLMMEGKENETV